MEALVWKFARKGDVSSLQALLAVGSIDPNQGTPLFAAVENGHAKCLAVLLDHPDTDPSPIDDESGVTPLHVAARRGDAASLDVLLAHPDVDPNAASRNGATALHFAVHLGHLGCVRGLLAHARIDPNKTRHGATPLHEAVYHCGKSGANVARTRAIMAALLNHPRTDPNLSDAEGYAPLHAAVLRLMHGGVCELLAHPRIDPNREVAHTNRCHHGRGLAPLHLCLSFYGWVPRAKPAPDAEYTACISAILSHPRTQPDKLDAEGKSPLHTAMLYCRVGSLQLFLDHAEVNVNRPCRVHASWPNEVLRPPLHAVMTRLWHAEERAAYQKFISAASKKEPEKEPAPETAIRTVLMTMLRHERVDISNAYEFAVKKAQALYGRNLSATFEETAAAVAEEEVWRKRWRSKMAWITHCVTFDKENAVNPLG